MSGIVAVEGLQFEIYEEGTLNSSGVVTVSSSCVPCSKVTIKGKKVYAGTLLVEVKGFSSMLKLLYRIIMNRCWIRYKHDIVHYIRFRNIVI